MGRAIGILLRLPQVWIVAMTLAVVILNSVASESAIVAENVVPLACCGTSVFVFGVTVGAMIRGR